MTEWHTRSLTIDESATLMRKLTIEIGHSQASRALRVIADMGAGVFMAKEGTEGTMSALEATRRNMREHMDEPGLIAFSPHTGERCSADHGDYFWLPDDEPTLKVWSQNSDDDEPSVIFEVVTDYAEGETYETWLDRVGWPVIATLINVTDPGTFMSPYLFDASRIEID